MYKISKEPKTKKGKTSCVAETRAVLVDHEVRREKREEILIPDHGCAQASLAIGSRTAVEGYVN
jgi:hypothetical protein